MTRPGVAALAAMVLTSGPAWAQGTVTLPDGCTAFVTVQEANCNVSHFMTCRNDAEGTLRRLQSDADGAAFLGLFDRESQWLESTYRATGSTETLEESPRDRASITELLAEGIDSYDFRTHSEQYGITRYVGADQLSGETRTIHGIELLVSTYVIRAESASGEVLYTSEGYELLSPEWRIFLTGEDRTQTEISVRRTVGLPVDIALPGEPGYLARRPTRGCD